MNHQAKNESSVLLHTFTVRERSRVALYQIHIRKQGSSTCEIRLCTPLKPDFPTLNFRLPLSTRLRNVSMVTSSCGSLRPNSIFHTMAVGKRLSFCLGHQRAPSWWLPSLAPLRSTWSLRLVSKRAAWGVTNCSSLEVLWNPIWFSILLDTRLALSWASPQPRMSPMGFPNDAQWMTEWVFTRSGQAGWVRILWQRFRSETGIEPNGDYCGDSSKKPCKIFLKFDGLHLGPRISASSSAFHIFPPRFAILWAGIQRCQ